jgi:alpha-tubulin suppressor-like RCC1 family protein/subtilisin-like proprotein convertase family protein
LKIRASFGIGLCLLLAAGAWLFWSHENGRDGSPGRPQQTVAPAVRPQLPSGLITTKSASTAPVLFGPGNSSTNTPTKTNQFAYRLNNTTKTIGELMNNPHAILLANAFIDTDAKLNFSIPKNLQSQGDPGAYIVQANGPIDDAFRTMLAAAGAQIVSYIPNNAYLVRISSGGAAAFSGKGFAVLPYEPEYKLSSSLLAPAVEQKSLPPDAVLNLGLFADNAAATIAQIEKIAGPILATDSSPFGPIVRVAPPKNWTALATLPGVQIVELFHSRKPANDLARVTMGISKDTQVPTNYMGLSGLNVLVEMNDSGVDANHPDFEATTNGGVTRIIGDSALSLVDTNGHGTHVAGIIIGNGLKSATVTNAQGSINPGVIGQYRGKAPLANLFSVGFLDASGNSLNVPDRYLQETPALTNALISNNSWNFIDDNEYDLAAASYDAAVRDALPQVTGSQPVLFVFAAGNNGGGDDSGGQGASDTILSPATAKNVITVGALEQLRNITNVVTDLNSNMISVWQPQTDSSSQVAFYSSRGNVGIGTEGTFGRFKPDVVAPGSFVVSTRSGQWDQAAYYNPTNFTFGEIDNQVIDIRGLNFYSLSVPENAVGVQIFLVPNISSPSPFPSLPIYVKRIGFPTTNINDFVKLNNQVSIPPDGGGGYIQNIQGTGFNYAIGNSTNFPVSYDIITEIITTNEDGNFFTVLSNLNDSIGSGVAPYTGGYYRYESGTSMSAPAVSGMLALMQDYFTNTLHVTPSPALLKAMLINGARAVGNYTYAITNDLNFEGWGLINLPDSLPPGIANKTIAPCSSFFLDQSPTNALATGDSHTFKVVVGTDSFAQFFPLQVTLAWTDPPGDPAAAIKLVNNLDLVVSNMDTGDVYFGNDIPPDSIFNSPSDTNFPPNLDSINNVENVIIQPLLAGNYSITIVGRDVNVNAVTAQTNNAANIYAPNVVQDFALVISCGEGEVTNAITVTDFGVASHPTTDQQITFVTAANTPLLNQFVGANTPLLGTNQVQLGSTNELVTLGMTNQWHFYVVTNTMGLTNSAITNAAFITFLPDTLSIPRMGVFADSEANATRPEADIDLYVSTDPSLTNLNPVAISNCVNGTQIRTSSLGAPFNGASLSRGGTEFVVDTGSTPGEVYYVGVKSEDQNASEYGFLSVFTATPFSSIDGNGNEIVNGLLLPVNIPDGTPKHPGIGYIFALGIQPMIVENVIVSDSITHQNFGDLVGTLRHNQISDVLNNHDSIGSTFPPNPSLFSYDDSGSGQFIGSQPSDGPGSLRDFTGTQAIGPWILTEADNSLTQTGAVTGFQLTVQPHIDLTGNGHNFRVAPNTWIYGFVDVPVGSTSLTVAATNVSVEFGLGPIAPNPLQLFVEPGFLPTLANTNGVSLTNCLIGIFPTGTDPGNSISTGSPVQPGRYFVGVYNPNNVAQEVFVQAFLPFSASAIATVGISTSNSVSVLDDAVTYSSIFVTNTDIIQSLNVGLRVDHPRISDLVFHLVSPDGTRYLLMENRGGTSTNGAGVTILNTIISPVTSSGGQAAETNTIDTGQSSGSFEIDYNFFTAPDTMEVFDGGTLLTNTGFINGSGTLNLNYSGSPIITIVMNPGGNTNNPTTLWNYTVTSTKPTYYYLTLTDNTNLATIPIKFAPPPFVPGLNASLTFTDSFEGAAAQDYLAGQPFGNGWKVVTNQVSVVNDPTNAANGNQFLALANGTISNSLVTVPGQTYTMSFAYRGPGITALWSAENSPVDAINGNNGTLLNGATYTNGEVGTAFKILGLPGQSGPPFTGPYVQVPNSSLWNFATNDFTIDLWANFAAVPTGDFGHPSDGMLIGCDIGAGTQKKWFFTAYAGGLEFHFIANMATAEFVGTASFTPVVNQWYHLAIERRGSLFTTYINGVAGGSTTDAKPIPDTNAPLTIGQAEGFYMNGLEDEVSIYNRALSPSELKAIYQKGSAGKFDTNAAAPQSLAEATANLSGAGPVTISGNNTNWQTYTTTFIAPTNGTALSLAGIEPGMLLDNFSLQQTPANLYYLPEQDISALNGQSAFGTWQLEIQDDRAGAGLTNSLVSWQLGFTFANTNFVLSPLITPLPPFIPLTNIVPANSIAYFIVTVPLNADIATNRLIFASAPVNLLFNQTTLPTGTNAGDFTFVTNQTSGTVIMFTNGVPPPPLIPGSTYLLGVQNTNNFAVTNTLEVDFHLLASGAPFAFTEPATLVTGTNAQLNGMATPNGFPATAWFQWGTNTFYGNQTPPVSVGIGFNVIYTTSQIFGLVTNVPYHFRLVVSNALAVTYGFDQILDEANVVAWGADYAGQINVPAGLSNVVSIAGAYDHSLALKTNGLVAAWGDNTFGQATVPANVSNVVAVAGGQYYSLALKSSGIVSSWGANILNQTNVPAGLSNVVVIAGGTYSSLALRNDGTVVAWGASFFGLTNVPASASNTVAIAGGSYHSLALKNDGTITAWGDDSSGQTDLPAGLSNVVAIAGGGFHSLALKTNGQVVAWGDNSAGQTNVPAGLSNVVAIAAGGFHSLALKANGTVVAWGDDTAGQTSVPLGLTNVVAISGGYLHSLALTPQSGINPSNSIILDLFGGVPQTNTILAGGINYYRVTVPTNADAATNTLLFAFNGPLNVWFSTNVPPTIGAPNDTLLLAGVTNGVSVLNTNSVPKLIPGSIYYLGVQNTNNFTVTYGIEVDFHLVTSTTPPAATNIISIFSITPTNISGQFGFLLTWFAPSNDLFQVQWTPSLAPQVWSTFTNIVSYNTNFPASATNAQFNFFDDASQTGGTFGPARFYRLILLGSVSALTNGAPQTNSISSNSITYFSITVPPNADFATNLLLSATAPVNLLFNQATPPFGTNAGDFELLTNSIGGTNILGLSTTPPLVPGSTYYLGVQNTNGFAVTFALQVNFHLLPPANNPISISSIVFTNAGGTPEFLLTWFAPTNDVFQVQWTPDLAPANWQFFTNFITYDVFLTPSNSQFDFLDDGSQTGGTLGLMRFYRLILAGLIPPTQTNVPSISSVTSTNMGTTNGFSINWSAPTNELFEVQWTTNLMPVILWHTFPNIIAYSTLSNPTNGLFNLFDDGSQGGLGPLKLYRLILLP